VKRDARLALDRMLALRPASGAGAGSGVASGATWASRD